MKDLNEDLPYGATPLDADEFSQLIPAHIKYLWELNELEQKNISDALIWLVNCRKNNFFTISFILKLHQKMFNNVWNWAGKFRNSNKNIGCDWAQISIELKNLLDNVQYWLENKTYHIGQSALGSLAHKWSELAMSLRLKIPQDVFS